MFQVFYYPMHGQSNWMYVIDVAPQTHRVLQDMDDLTPIDEINRILHDVDKICEEEGSSTEEEIIYYNSTSTDGSSSSDSEAKSGFLKMGDENTMVVNHDNLGDTISHNTIGLHLEVVLEIDHDYLYADVPSPLVI